MRISVVIITKNEESNIKRCLDSLHEVADEIIVIDSFSTDSTEAICRSYPNLTFVSRTWQGYAAAKNYGNDLAQHPYILSIDADEVLSDKLRLEILSLKPILRGGYVMPRLNHIGQKPIKFSGWYPDAKVRLFPKAEATWVGDFVHEKLIFKGEIQRLTHDLLHFTYSSFEQFDKKMRHYAALGAQDMFTKGKKMSAFFMVLKVIFKFFSVYILKFGFLDGREGRLIATESSKSIYWKYTALQQLNRTKTKP
ncbi:MAG: glycosyltransferase family 2 protein [Saprospiraceae bacterium]|nr:glycosyltransferase family 2 protein [Saprospiraceae bacterium]